MRVLLILVAAVIAGLSLGAGMSWLGPSAKLASLPKRWHGKGPAMLLESPPKDASGPGGDWNGDDRQISHGVRITRGRGPSVDAEEASTGAVYYAGCREVRRDGKAPLYRGQPGYREGMDGDGDGIACEDYGAAPL